mmetsp:Transcript_5200/g.21302  ORF Transcript_5200/g.21302 Transcript_5200/m.21302 type:complete len:208 (-) Transcript_5200:631-1254(-)
MMSTEVRPMIRYPPRFSSSYSVASPVMKNPSPSKHAAVASGLPTYPPNTPGPLTRSSPSTIFTSTPGKGWPTRPGTRRPRRGCDSAMPISVAPYRSNNSSPPAISDHRLATGTGIAADPLTHSLNLDAAADISARRSSLVTASYAWIRRTYMVGTPMNIVVGVCFQSTTTRHHCVAENLAQNVTCAPLACAHIHAFTMPCTWFSGSA